MDSWVLVVVVVVVVIGERVGSCAWIWVYQKLFWGAFVLFCMYFSSSGNIV